MLTAHTSIKVDIFYFSYSDFCVPKFVCFNKNTLLRRRLNLICNRSESCRESGIFNLLRSWEQSSNAIMMRMMIYCHYPDVFLAWGSIIIPSQWHYWVALLIFTSETSETDNPFLTANEVLTTALWVMQLSSWLRTFTARSWLVQYDL